MTAPGIRGLPQRSKTPLLRILDGFLRWALKPPIGFSSVAVEVDHRERPPVDDAFGDFDRPRQDCVTPRLSSVVLRYQSLQMH